MHCEFVPAALTSDCLFTAAARQTQPGTALRTFKIFILLTVAKTHACLTDLGAKLFRFLQI